MNIIVPNFEPQKVLHLHKELEKANPKLLGEYAIFEKYDGWYGYMYYDGESFSRIHSSAGRPIPAFDWIQEECNKYKERYGVSIIGPHWLIFELDIPGMPFYKKNGIFNRKSEQATDAICMLHDVLALNHQNIGFIDRYKYFISPFYEYCLPGYIFKQAELLTVSSDKSEWEKQFYSVVDRGGEGIILKACNSSYFPGKRNSSMLKWKLEETYDLKCKDIVQTIGEKGYPAVNAILYDEAHDVEVTVRIGKIEDEKYFLENKSYIVGKYICIRCMSFVKEEEKYFYREPRFSHIREDL